MNKSVNNCTFIHSYKKKHIKEDSFNAMESPHFCLFLQHYFQLSVKKEKKTTVLHVTNIAYDGCSALINMCNIIKREINNFTSTITM